MVIKSEQLLESLLDLERSRQRERESRMEAEALLDGLRGITGAVDKEGLFQSLLYALRHVVDFEEAFLLELSKESTMKVLASTEKTLLPTVWHPGSVFRRCLSGRPVASFNIDQIPEWQQQPKGVTAHIRSALHIGLNADAWEGILIITHSQPKHFGLSHVKKAKRFSPLASQALLTLALRQAVIQRDRFFDLTMDLMAIFDKGGRIKQFNQGWSELLGFDDLDFQTGTLIELIHQEDIESFETVMDFLTKMGGKQLIEVRFLKKNNTFCWLSCSLASYRDEQLFYIVARDITDSVVHKQRLAHAAGHDALTGLSNRAGFMEVLKHEFTHTKKDPNHSFAVFFLDLDKFKNINDTLGHDIGDELLKSFGAILCDSVRKTDTVARLGGDEFTLLIRNIQSETCVREVTERIQAKCRHRLNLKGQTVQISTSIGIALSSPLYKDEEELLKEADGAMYEAKRQKQRSCVLRKSHPFHLPGQH